LTLIYDPARKWAVYNSWWTDWKFTLAACIIFNSVAKINSLCFCSSVSGWKSLVLLF